MFISSGRQDPICSVEESVHVKMLFEKRGTQVEQVWGGGHEVTATILDEAKKRLED